MTTISPVVTVIMLVFNRARYVGQAIESVLQQTYPHFELLVIDDASTDDSAAIVRSYKDPRIRLISNPHNLGISKSRNIGTQHARGRYIAILDSDDYTYPTRLEKQVQFMETHADHAVVGSWENWIDENGRITRRKKVKPVNHDDIRAHLLFRSCMAHSSCMIRADALKSYLYNPAYIVCEDYDLWARISSNYKLANIPEILISRRKHTGNISHNQSDREARLTITRYQLDNLGVQYTDRDVDNHVLMHYLTTQGRIIKDKEYLNWSKQWLNNLVKSNQRSRLYESHSFLKCIEYRWRKVCRNSTNAKLSAFKNYFSSPISFNYMKHTVLSKFGSNTLTSKHII